MNIGKSIKIANAMRGKTQDQLAIGIGVSPVTVSRIVTGKIDLSCSRLIKIAEFYGLKASEFILLGE